MARVYCLRETSRVNVAWYGLAMFTHLRSVLASLVISSAGIVGCGGASPGAADASISPDAVRVETIESRLFRHLSGRFSSNAQSRMQPSYFDVRLTTCAVDAPELGAYVLYVEQAIADATARPYRQRIYVVQRGTSDAQGVSQVLELVAPRGFIGACDDDNIRTVTPEETVERPGCHVVMNWDGVQFDGGTVGRECLSDFSGATYATSEVQITATGLRSWDRGFDASDLQVWGASEGPYQFERVTPLPDPQ